MLILYADDTNIFAEDKNLSQLFKKVNAGLIKLNKWFQCNRLTLNLKKTEFIYFRGPGVQRPLQEELKIGGEKIRQVDGVKFLGVWVDEGLRWTTHIGKVTSPGGQ